MLYRFLIIAIVLFWASMTALLFRMELSSGNSAMLAVPAAHVLKQMFLHEQASDLGLYHQGQRLGSFHLQPKRAPDLAGRPFDSLTITGGFPLNLPGAPMQRLSLRAILEFDAQQTVQRFDIAASIHEPGQNKPGIGLALEGWPARNDYHYQVRRGETVVKNASGTPLALLDDPDLRSLGFDPRAILSQAAHQQASSTQITAHRSSLRASGETIETYLLTIHHAESLETTIQITQLGQVLQVKSFTGYDLYDDTLAP